MQIKTISILGCGWFGLPLAKSLSDKGFSIKGSTTTLAKVEALKQSGIKGYLVQINAEDEQFDPEFFDTDLLIISIPPRSKSPDAKDYPLKIKRIADRARNSGIKHVIFISSTGVFEDGNFVVDENTVPHPTSEAGKSILGAEELLKSNSTFSTTIIRFAGLIGPHRNLAKHFAGKGEVANGLAPINLIHLEDCIGITASIIAQSAYGYTYHGVTPDHPTRADFYTAACVASGFEKPDFLMEKLTWKQIESINIPRLLGYKYVFQKWLPLVRGLA